MLSITYQQDTKTLPLNKYTNQDLKSKIKELFEIQQDFDIVQRNNNILVLDLNIQQDLNMFMSCEREQEFYSFSTKCKLITK